jgi:hypothetical protein
MAKICPICEQEKELSYYPDSNGEICAECNEQKKSEKQKTDSFHTKYGKYLK